MNKVAEEEAVAKGANAHEAKWGQQLIAAGYGAVPNILLQRHAQLGMSPTELVLFLLLASFWWKRDERPFPSILELAKAMGMNPRNIQRRLRRMEQVGFIRISKRKARHGGHKSNEYDLTPLIKEANKLAADEVGRRKKAGLAKLGRTATEAGKPPLKVVKS
jgi:DNA-binding MarR family transcriptional regulator